jgi:hypothetical protein
VHAFSLPSTSSLRSAYGIGWSAPCIAHYGSYEACGGDAGAASMLVKYARLALDHRISISEVVEAGPSTNANGGFDWSLFDATYGPLFDGTAGSLLPGAKLTAIRYLWTADQAHYSAWAQHFRQKGWFGRTFDYTCDEPPNGCAWSDIPSRAALVHAADAQFQTLVTTTLADAQKNGVTSSIDILVPADTAIDPRLPAANTRAAYDPFLSSAQKAVWLYQTCDSHGCNGPGPVELSGWPTRMIDAPATENRAMEWQAWRERVSGELYYDTTYAFTRGNAWSTQYYFGGNGEGNLFYPGTPAAVGGTSQIPIASLRMKLIRDGMEDYEYFKKLSDAGDPAMADAEAAKLSPHAYQNESDPAAIDAARHRIALRIEALTGQTPPPMTTGGGASDGGSGNGSMNDGGNLDGNGSTNANGTGGNAATGSSHHGGCAVGAQGGDRGAEVIFVLAILVCCVERQSRRSRADSRAPRRGNRHD